jgi:hypothetical protein
VPAMIDIDPMFQQITTLTKSTTDPRDYCNVTTIQLTAGKDLKHQLQLAAKSSMVTISRFKRWLSNYRMYLMDTTQLFACFQLKPKENSTKEKRKGVQNCLEVERK